MNNDTFSQMAAYEERHHRYRLELARIAAQSDAERERAIRQVEVARLNAEAELIRVHAAHPEAQRAIAAHRQAIHAIWAITCVLALGVVVALAL